MSEGAHLLWVAAHTPVKSPWIIDLLWTEDMRLENRTEWCMTHGIAIQGQCRSADMSQHTCTILAKKAYKGELILRRQHVLLAHKKACESSIKNPWANHCGVGPKSACHSPEWKNTVMFETAPYFQLATHSLSQGIIIRLTHHG